MISFEDCVGLCGLTQAEIEAVAEHEHIPEIAAAALASYLLHTKNGPGHIKAMIVGDIRSAVRDGRLQHGAELLMALRHFLESHPEAKAEA